MRRVYSIALLLLVALGLSATTKEVKLKLVETSDIHGNFFPYNFIEQREWGGSLARVYSFVQEERRAYGDNLLLLDNGDILQGQPSAYYYNFMDTVSTHIASAMMNYMGYNAGNMGKRLAMPFSIVGSNNVISQSWVPILSVPPTGRPI